MKIVECVPNISEGRVPEIYNAVAEAAASVPGVKLLDVDPGVETNRTVITIVGEPEAVLEGAFQLVVAARKLIDMRAHHGAHGRMGAVDVCPFVPVAEVTMDDCVELSRRLGASVGEELSLPVYLYEFAATRPERKSLADIRKGEYEALPTKLQDPDFAARFRTGGVRARVRGHGDRGRGNSWWPTTSTSTSPTNVGPTGLPSMSAKRAAWWPARTERRYSSPGNSKR